MPVQMNLTSMQETLSSVITSCEKMAAARGDVRIDTCYDSSVPDFVTTDGHRLTEILNHLLEHAIMHSKDNGTVKFGVSAVTAKEILRPSEIRSGNENEAFLRFVIKDNGICKEQIVNIFKPYQGESGIGMAVASKLVEDLDGIISAKSKVGGSTIVTVDLPIGGKPVDTNDFARKFQQTTVFMVGNNPSDNLFLAMLAKYQVDVVKLDSCGDMEALVQSRQAVDKRRIHLCLVQEDLYRDRSYQQLADVAPSALLTFGPQHLVTGSKTHFSSLTRILPCVIAKSMMACLELIRISQKQTTVSSMRRVPSMSDARMRSFDFSKIRALIAEDNTINQKVLQRMLRRKGVKHIDVVDDGQKAVDAITRDKKDYGTERCSFEFNRTISNYSHAYNNALH